MELRIGKNSFKPEIRRASDLKPVLAFPEALKDDFDAYFMFRDVYKREEDYMKIKKFGLRYDYTIIPPNDVGGEKIKTYGHYHPEIFGTSYPEVYQIIDGKAFFILQKRVCERVVDVVVVEAKDGDVVIVPPYYGHVLINPTDEEIHSCNWVCRNFHSIYEPYTKKRGACYYYIEEKWVRNRNYPEAPEIRTSNSNNIFDVENIYELVDEIELLEFLVNPHKNFETLQKIKI
ncbi:MAG: glucose-6-phosphate isomerase family protein [Archaeoglobales archaeon]|nr:glucose-6-phosphate isomerase family protein [Archaeoglobales archaeon]